MDIVGSLRCNDGDSNENFKKAIDCLGKQQLCTCITLFFLYIFLPSLHNYDVKSLISRFMEDVNK